MRRGGSRPSGRYPIATIAAYGPTNALATKLVASVIKREGRDPIAVRTWITVAVDVRHDLAIADDLASFLREHRVAESVGADRIIGCPHEEGIDYPIGRVCPRCPFWADIDRFTHEPLTRPSPTMAPSEVLSALSQPHSTQPLEALASADGHREALIEPLLIALDRGIANPSGASDEEADLFSYALYLMARWREPRAYPHVCRWLSLPGEGPFEIGGDIVTQDGGRILAAVCDGDLEPLKALATNLYANEYGRGAAITALARLAAWAERPRESIVDVLLWLAREGLERQPNRTWDTLAIDAVDLEAREVFPEIRRAYEEGLVDPQSMAPAELEEVELMPAGDQLRDTQDRYPPIDDVAEAIAWWGAFDKSQSSAREVPTVRVSPKVGRNDPCPCGSGKKYKKCCGG